MKTCPNGHAYSSLRRWCPICGTLTPKEEQAPDPKELTTVQVWRVPKILKRRFKTACFVASTNMRDQLLKFMDEYSTKMGYVKVPGRKGPAPLPPVEVAPAEKRASAAKTAHLRGEHHQPSPYCPECKRLEKLPY